MGTNCIVVRKSVFDEVGKAIKANLPSEEIHAYANAMHALYDANQAVADAQDNLNAVTAKYDQLLMPLNEVAEDISRVSKAPAIVARRRRPDMGSTSSQCARKSSTERFGL